MMVHLSGIPTWSAVAEASWPCTEPRDEVLVQGYEPATPLFPSTRNCPQHDAKAVSPSYARKLASDSATALQVSSSPPFRTVQATEAKRNGATAYPPLCGTTMMTPERIH